MCTQEYMSVATYVIMQLLTSTNEALMSVAPVSGLITYRCLPFTVRWKQVMHTIVTTVIRAAVALLYYIIMKLCYKLCLCKYNECVYILYKTMIYKFITSTTIYTITVTCIYMLHNWQLKNYYIIYSLSEYFHRCTNCSFVRLRYFTVRHFSPGALSG